MNKKRRPREYFERVADIKICAEYIIENDTTIRKAAKFCGIEISKSILQRDIERVLKVEDLEMYKKVRKVLDKNKAEKHMRGGLSTKRKFEKMKK